MTSVVRGGELTARQTVEALRNGVPNRQAVIELGCNQPRAEERFRAMLVGVDEIHPRSNHAAGMLVSGDFGAGKSHLLEHLQHLALSNNFVCSRVAISKETPLYDLGKVFSSAMENAKMPDGRGRFIEELGELFLGVGPETPTYRAFIEWAEGAVASSLLSPMFLASMRVYREAGDRELNGDIESFWAGERILVSKIRAGLRQIGAARAFKFRVPKVSELPLQRLRFAVELMRSVGYRGWVVLLDEIELIGSYSVLQRGRSYAEIARWIEPITGASIPGLVAVGAVTDDFATAIISPDGQKKDRDYIRAKLDQNPRHSGLGGLAERGMRILERDSTALAAPSDEDVRAMMDTLRALYHRAYGWEPPPQEVTAGGAGFLGRMRYKVRAAINEWDLTRLHGPYVPETEAEGFTPSYAEDAEHERGDGGHPA